ncbi:MAG TPA: septation protein SepH [Dermatophilaceae bacterium]|nr:septation protein SepH [Dermatophilaceae bacterium]
MDDLQLIGVHEDGEHLVLASPEGTRFRLRVNDALRSAVRRDRPKPGLPQVDVDGELRPRDVQALIRAGASAEDVAERAGWSVEKVRSFQVPIIAEREHVVELARQTRLRSRGGGGGPTLSHRVAERLTGRGVDPGSASWDSWRSADRPWTVAVTFAAGGRQRQASWRFDLVDRSLTAADDEARWLSEEAQPAPLLGTTAGAPGEADAVYDQDAEPHPGQAPPPAMPAQEQPVDLMTAMRERSTARDRGRSGRRASRHDPAEQRTPPGVPLPLPDLPPRDLPLPDLPQPAPAETAKSHDPPSPDRETGPASEVLGAPLEQAPLKEAPEDQALQEQAPSRRAPRRGRPSVPAWDDIMFGSRPSGD